MFDHFRSIILATSAGLVGLLGLRGEVSTIIHPFNKINFDGWHTLGTAEWRPQNGVIAASAKNGSGGWLVLDRGYEDVILKLTFQCSSCDAGVLLRNAAVDGGRSSGLYVPIAGGDAANVYRVTLDAQGRELDRKLVSARKPRNSLATVTALGDGWNEFSMIIHGAVGAESTRGTAMNDTGEHYGQIGLGLSSGDLRIKDIALDDLLKRHMGLPDEITGMGFHRVQLTDRYYSEGITAGDFNHDGVMDVVAGPYYYPGPSFQNGVEIYPPRTYSIGAANQAGGYTDSFILYSFDINHDGWTDILKVDYCCAAEKPGVYLYLNPKAESRHWDEYKVVETNDSETTAFGDVDGDGKPELILTVGRDPNRVVGYAKPDWSDVKKPWTFHAVSPKGSYGGHAVGFGDVNGDGRIDILVGTAWLQQPASGAENGLWEVHTAPFGRGDDPFIRGADMLLYDVNGDGLPDVIGSLFAHGPGLAWWEQRREGGTISWKMHMIMDKPDATPEERVKWEETDKSVAFTELHGLALTDIDGDGVKDIVTGKRWWSHGIEYPEDDFDSPPVVYWFKLVRKSGGQVEFVPKIVTNIAGLGTQIVATDVNGDGRPDILTAGRRGAYVYLNAAAK